MIVRALVAVMTLAGAVPYRVCTCGAVHFLRHATARPIPTDGNPPPRTPSVAPYEQNPDGHHDPDCHAVKPRPAMTVAVPPACVDVPGDDLTGVILAEPPEAAFAPVHVEEPARPPPRGSPPFPPPLVLRN